MIDDEATKKPDLHEVLRVKELERLDALYKRIESGMNEGKVDELSGAKMLLNVSQARMSLLSGRTAYLTY